MNRTAERFLRYVAISTPSDENSNSAPSSVCQFDLARYLEKELAELGFQDVRVTDNCYVYASLPATKGMDDLPVIGLIAHMDTSPSYNGNAVKPQIHPDYDGNDVVLPGSGSILSVKEFPHLSAMKGKTLITTDGNTLLGADDKAGIAEIISACERIITSGKPHGKIAVAFTPDEELGRGANLFDVKGFGADYAYTVDGGKPGELSYENFNACHAKLEFFGTNIHPGSAKNIMVNAILLGMEFNSMLPALDIPRETELYQGFFHLMNIAGDESHLTMEYIIRDHNPILFENRKDMFRHICDAISGKWGEGRVKLTLCDQYRNMREVIEKNMFLVDNAVHAMEKSGMVPFTDPMRGGTDGARLCYMGLPCPNLCTGGYAFHGPFEHIAAEDMECCTDMICHLIMDFRK